MLRRIYAAVRDRRWDTAPAALSNLRVESGGDSFRAAFDAECRLGDIGFAWKGSISGGPEGTVTFSMDGIARSTFLRNRIGICVLHPIRECAGRPCRVEHTDGSTERGKFPEDVSPHQPFKAVRAIAHEAAPGVEAEVRFEGDTFETEDQRNWTDASFKTYSTPLDLPFPVEVKAGTRISQSVTLSLRGTAPAVEPDEPLAFTVGDAPAGPLPRIGLCLSEPSRPPEAARLRALGLSHLRADLDLSGDIASRLAEAAAEARALGASLELAIHLSDDAPRKLERLRQELQGMKSIVSSFLVFQPEWIDAARKALRPFAPVGAGTDSNFAELNLNRPPEGADFLFYPANPQVHLFDDATLIENLEAQGDTVRCARRFSGGRPVAVTPVTLKPRFIPSAPDARQKTLFGAAWTVGSLKSLAEAGASSVTYFETRGVLEGDRVFPLHHVLADALEFSGGEVLPSSPSDPLVLTGLALRKGARTRVLVANLTAQPRHALLENLPGKGRIEIDLSPHEVARIDSP